MIVTPAILSQNKEDFFRKLKVATGLSRRIQVDFMDGQFVPSRSLSLAEMPDFSAQQAVAHLMVNYPENYLYPLKEKQFAEVIFHLEAKGVNFELVEKAVSLSFTVALALNPGSSPSKIKSFASLIKAGKVAEVLLLAVDPGYSGQKFKPEVLQKVEAIKKLYQVKVSLDGGINSKNISLICQKPVSEIYVGSGLLEQKDPASEYKKLVLSCQR